MTKSDKKTDQIFNEIKPTINIILAHLGDTHRKLIEASFSNVVDLAEQLVSAKANGDEDKVNKTLLSLQHSVSALTSIIISTISVLENPVKQSVSQLALIALNNLLIKLFSSIK